MSTIMISAELFGKFNLRVGSRSWDARENCKTQELLCYLLIHRNLRHQRERIASLFWECSSITQAKKYLRQALWQLQVECGERLGLAHDRLVVVNSDWIRLNPEIKLQTDVEDFEQAYSSLRPGAKLDAAVAERWKYAVGLYHGDMLESCYQNWCLYERERLQNIYLVMLDKLIEYCETHGDYEIGLSYGSLILQRDPARERAHQRMMLLHYLAGDRTAALRQFGHCAAALSKELGVKPSKRTYTLYEQVRADQLEPTLPLSCQSVLETQASPSAILNHLRQLQEVIIDMQRQLLQMKTLVEQYLPSSPDRT